MKAYYELMDFDSANVVGFYETKDDAFAIIRHAFDEYGLAGVEDLALSEKSDRGEDTFLREGSELLRLTTEKQLSPAAG